MYAAGPAALQQLPDLFSPSLFFRTAFPSAAHDIYHRYRAPVLHHIGSLHNSWDSLLDTHVSPHILQHTGVTSLELFQLRTTPLLP